VIPSNADIRAGIAYILKNNPNVQAWASDKSIDLDDPLRFKEYDPFAPVLDMGVLIDVEVASELSSESSCDTPYDARFILYVGYTGAGSTAASNWLAVLETALAASSGAWAPCTEGRGIFIRDVEHVSRLGQTRTAEAWLLPSNFRCLAEYI
jgi:hypothetical protein